MQKLKIEYADAFESIIITASSPRYVIPISFMEAYDLLAKYFNSLIEKLGGRKYG